MAEILKNKKIRFFIFAILFFLIGFSIVNLISLSISHWYKPSLYADSYRLVEQNNQLSTKQWILSQHNEHRIVFSKLFVLFEEKILKIAPGQSSLFQNFALVLLSGGIWTLINKKFFADKNIRLISSISGLVILLHPWQWQNFVWEFQVPWFFTNVLVLLGTYLLLGRYNSAQKINYVDLCIFLLPWVSIFNSGQGIAFAFALTISSTIKNIRLGVISLISTLLSLMTYFYFLNYVKPGFHPSYNFDLKFFLGMLFGGIWHGLFVLILLSIFSYALVRPPINKNKLPTLLLPSIFSTGFTLMTTLSRSEFGLRVAGSSRYTTHTLMMGLSAILLMGIIAESNKIKSLSSLIGLSTILITLGAFPQSLIFNNFRGYSFFKVWNKMYEFNAKNRRNFLCIADKIVFQKKGIEVICDSAPHHDDLAPAYFSNKLAVKPIGWHRLQTIEELDNEKNIIKVKKNIHTINFSPQLGLNIKGRIIATSKNRYYEKIFLVANYSNSERLIFYLGNKFNNKNDNYHFEKLFPTKKNGNLINNLKIETRNSSELLWQNNNLKTLN